MRVFFIIICILVLVVLGCFWFYLYKRDQEMNALAKVEPDDEEDEEEDEKKPCYSRFLAESCITKDYSRPQEDNSFSSTPLHQELWEKLKRMDKDHPWPADEKWFINHIRDCCRFGDVLAVIENYPRLTELFFANLHNPDDLELQKRLISISIDRKTSHIKANYTNLMCNFCSRWDYTPDIKVIIDTDPRFETALKIYKLYHK